MAMSSSCTVGFVERVAMTWARRSFLRFGSAVSTDEAVASVAAEALSEARFEVLAGSVSAL